MKSRYLARAVSLLLLFAAVAGAHARNYVLIPLGDRWRYLANGSEPGTKWRQSAFRALDWPLATAEIGYGDGSQATVIPPPPPNAAQTTTTYFQKVFICLN